MSATTRLMTAEELIRLPRGQHRYELIKGELLTMSPSGGEHGVITVNLTAQLAVYVKANSLGFVFGAETGFKLERDPDTVLAPDIGFISKNRLSQIPKGYLEIAPDLAVEVISPSESKTKIERKTAQWLAHGVREVWVVKPKTETVEVHRVNESRILAIDSELIGSEILPGFKIAVAAIFEV
jgi:Uma2 family endonuclease